MEGITQDFIQAVEVMLAKTLSNNNEERNANEALYNQLLLEKPEGLFLSLIAALKSSPTQVRTLSAVLIKKLVSPSSGTWDKISDISRSSIKNELLIIVVQEPERKIKELIAEDIGLLGVNILTSQGSSGTWPELLPFVNQMIEVGAPGRLAGLYVLNAMFPYMFQEMMSNSKELLEIFKKSIVDEDYNTKLACIKAMSSLISVADTKACLVFNELVPEVLRSVVYILDKNTYTGGQAIEIITELVQSEPKVFKLHFSNCIELTQHICSKPSLDIGLRNLILEFAVSISERIPTQIHKIPSLGTELLKLIFEMMIAIEFEVDESWKVPEEGFCEKDEEEEGGVDIDYAKVGRKLVSRLIDSVGDKYLLQPCLTSIQQALASAGDWRVSYAALMTLSEVLQYVEDDDRLIEALPIIYNNIASDHCKIRYAAFHVLGQICEDHGPDFQKKHHESIYPKLLQGLEDSVPRVVAHACAAVTNFIENIGPVLGSQYAALIVPKISTFLEAASPSIVVENTFTCLAAIANTVGEGFKTYYMPLLRNAIVLFEKYNQNQYRALLGRLIECITLTSKAVGKQTFDPFAYKVVSLMKYLQETGNSQEEITGYLMNGWQRICELLGEEFLAYADNIVPGLLKLISNNVEMSTSSAPTHFVDMALATEKKRKNFSTTETENKELGIQTLITFVEELKGGYIKYVESTVLATFPLLDFSLNEGVRSAAAVLLSSLVGIIKPVDLPKAIVMAKTFMEGIWNAIDDEYINETLVDELEAIREIIDTIQVPFLSQEEVKAIGQKSLKILENSLENRIKTQEDSDDEKDEGFQEYTKKEEDSLHTSISEVFGVLFKTHKNSCLEIVDFLYVQVFGRLLAPDTRDEDHKFVIFVIDDILEFLGQELVKEKWNNFGEVLVKFACDPHDAVRQAAVYGLGVFAQFTSVDSFAPWSSPIMEKLEAAITLPPGKSIKSHGNARDNAIASVGKLIKYQSSSLNLNAVVPAWLNLLPLKFDKIECKVINDLIADLLLDKPAILLGENYENLKHVTFLLIDALDTKFIKETTVPKVKEFFNRLQNLQINQVTQVWAQLNDSQKEKLSSLVKSSF